MKDPPDRLMTADDLTGHIDPAECSSSAPAAKDHVTVQKHPDFPTLREKLAGFVAAGQAAQEAVDEIIGPETAMERFTSLVNQEAGKLLRYREYFRAKGINPFRPAMMDLVKNFHDQFDGVAGADGISTK